MGRGFAADLLAELISTPDLEGYLERHTRPAPTLSEYLRRQLSQRGLEQAEALRRANLDQTFGWYVFSGKRGMGRENVLKLAFGMGFDAIHANRALHAAGPTSCSTRSARAAWGNPEDGSGPEAERAPPPRAGRILMAPPGAAAVTPGASGRTCC